MKELYPLKGVITTVITPFHGEKKEIDIDCLKAEIETAIQGKVAGFLVPCVASEIPYLSFDEKLKMVKAVSEVANGRAKVITSISSDIPEERIKLMKQFLDYGCTGINIALNYTDRDTFLRDIEMIDKEKPPFLIMQDVDFGGPGIPDEVLIEAFENYETVIGTKVEVQYSGMKYTRLLKATQGRMNISSGWGNDQLIELLDRGVHAIMPSGLFSFWAKVYELHASGKREQAKKLFYDMLPVISFTRQDQALNRSFHKRLLKKMGIFKTIDSRETVVFDEYHKAYADELMDRAIHIMDHLSDYE